MKTFARKKEIIDRALYRLYIKAACLGILGIIVLSVWTVLSSNTENVYLEILSIIGWVAVWEAVNIMIIERQALERTKKNLDKIINAKIVCQEAKMESAER